MQCTCAILLYVACPTLQHSSTLPHKWHDLKKKLPNIKFKFRFSLRLLSETLFIPRTERDMIKNIYWSPCKAPFFLSEFNET